jgi:hypothetical protein
LSDGLLELHGRVGEGGRDDERVAGSVDDADQDGRDDKVPTGRKEFQKTVGTIFFLFGAQKEHSAGKVCTHDIETTHGHMKRTVDKKANRRHSKETKMV